MALQEKYDEYQHTIRSLQEHVVSVESQLYEHEIVLDTLKSVPAERKAWRLISTGDLPDASVTSKGALVETNAGDASTKLDQTITGLTSLKNKLEQEIVDVRKEFDEWKTKHNIKVVQG
jgi:prefoldin subunit 2